MQRWDHSEGFSVDAGFRVQGGDRGGLARVLRYCARPPFTLEPLVATGAEGLVYYLA
jgi:hypothetical protein